MRQKLVRLVGGVAIAALALGGAAACKSDSASNEAGGGDGCGAKIAFFGALTGPNAALGINMNNGVKLALDKYNKENADCQVTLVPLDSQGNPEQAPGLAQQAIDDEQVLGVVGPAFSGESEAANPLFAEAGLVHVTPSATRTNLADQGWKTFFRVVGNDFTQSPAAAWYIENELKAEKVFVIDDQSAYGAGLADGVKEALGAKVVGSDKVQGDSKQSDFSATVTAVKSSGATAIFYGGYYPEAGLIRKQLTAAGVNATLVAADGVNDNAYIEGAGAAAAEGSIMTCPCMPASETGGTFEEDFKALHGTDPGTYSDTAFDATNILLEGIKAGNTTREKLVEFVRGYTGQGVAASYKFTDNGDLAPEAVRVWAYVVKDGKIVPAKEIPSS